MKNISKKFFIYVIILVLLFVYGCQSTGNLTTNTINTNNSSNLSVTFIDVGQADSAFISCDNKYMLIDGGNVDDSNLIVSFLQKKNISYIDYVINSHPDEDHIGGLSGALSNFSVGRVMCSTKEHNTVPFKNFKKYVENQGLEIEVPKCGDTFNLGNSKIEILSNNKDYGNTNDNSIVLKITYGKTSFMFTGDISVDVEDDIVNSGCDLKSTVLKVAHHGSKSSSGYVWLRSVLPEYSVISVGSDNKYGHPTEAALSRLRDVNTTLYRTDLQGDITAISDGSKVEFTTYKNALQGDINPTINESSKHSDNECIGNKNSKTFHTPECNSLPQEKNRVYFSSRQEALNEGYNPCKNCNS